MTISSFMLLLLVQAAAPAAPPRVQELPTKALAEAQVKALYQGIDTNKDGKVTRAEANAFHAAQQTAAEARYREAGAAAFAKADTDKNGTLSQQEFMAAGRGVPVTKEIWFDANDADRNGQVDLAEAVSRMQREFNAIDTNRDGTLTSQELSAAAARNAPAATATRPPAASTGGR